MKQVDLPNCGTLPDFGNFSLGGGKWYDRYKGVEELMPFAKAVSAKSRQFDEAGNESQTDYPRMMKIVRAAKYGGWVGIEWEGGSPSEHEGILLTKRILEKCGCVAVQTGDGPFKAPIFRRKPKVPDASREDGKAYFRANLASDRSLAFDLGVRLLRVRDPARPVAERIQPARSPSIHSASGSPSRVRSTSSCC